MAIVGIGCRFPGAANGDELWEMVRSGRDEITEVPPDRFPIDDFYDPRAGTPGKLSTRSSSAWSPRWTRWSGPSRSGLDT
ncbi:beta-ketoacyl synthase N-terminal-like domain-containing protein [Millisia brevis]|uniref:beta-ketoacyl synthase N-terminal-like domain-containing protein n=1 Tax=Millisia brevis TaxID=264148 RepID=UPI0034E1C4B9